MKSARPTVGVDIDGVLGNQVQGVLDRVNSRYGLSFRYEDVVEWNMQLGPTTFTLEIADAMEDSTYVLGMQVHDGAAAMLADLRDGWIIKILTVRPENATEWTPEWLGRNKLCYDELLRTEDGLKGVHGADVLIDDYPKNLAGFLSNNTNGYGILVDQPWNRSASSICVLEPWLGDPRRLTRVSRLLDIPEILSHVPTEARTKKDEHVKST